MKDMRSEIPKPRARYTSGLVLETTKR